MNRLVIFSAVLVGLLFLLLVRLADVQLFKGAEFLSQAEQNRYRIEVLPADRGIILDRYQQPLVKNYKVYWQKSSTDKTILDQKEALVLMASGSGEVNSEIRRRYTSQALSLVLGYVGLPSAEDLKADKTLKTYHLVGKLGLEKVFNSLLNGRDGQIKYEVSAQGQKQRMLEKTDSVSGENLLTSLDPNLADLAYQALGEQTGSVVVSDASNGAILALVSKPQFSANEMMDLMNAQDKAAARVKLQAILDDKRQLFFNRSLSGTYPPGSTFKLITSLAGLEKGAIDSQTTVDDQGFLQVGDYQYKNWYYSTYGHGEGTISLVRAIARSNDVYFYKVAEWTGVEAIAQMAKNFTLGQKPKIEIFGAAAGLVPTPEWKEKTTGERWYLGNTYHFGIGQGDTLASPLQMQQVVQALANRGNLCPAKLTNQTAFDCQNLGLKAENINLVLAGMIDACSSGGSAFPLFSFNSVRKIADAGVEENLASHALACKTGTAEFGGLTEQNKRRTHGWLVLIVEPKLSEARISAGFPKRIVLTIMIESDEKEPYKEGARDAAQVAKTILEWIES